MLSIRTQDRMALVPYDSKIEVSEVLIKETSTVQKYKKLNGISKEKTLRITFVKLNNTILGGYKTKERALKVLDEIIEAIVTSAYLMKEDGNLFPLNYVEDKVYQMPKE